MQRPETEYVRSHDGFHIAYQTIGDGSPDLVLLTSICAIDAMWDDPRFAHALFRLARLGRLICFDPRGQGGSDPVTLGALPTIDAWSDDVSAVLDAVGSSRTFLIGDGPGGSPLAIYLAASHPERTAGLVINNGCARSLRASDYPMGGSPEEMDRVLQVVEEQWGTGNFIASAFAPSRQGDEEFLRWHARYQRQAAAPKTSRALLEWAWRLDVRDALAHVQAPTLVLHAQDSFVRPLEFGRYLADHIRDGRLVILPGADIAIYGENCDEALDHIEEFLTGIRPSRPPERVLATVLFTDMVASTEAAARLGDHRWVEVLDQHEAVVSRALERHRGRIVTGTGDGMVATFDVPGRAVRCAQDICAAMRSVGIEVRAGVHTGEIELRGDDIGGIAVHIAARISALAGPGEVLASRTLKDLTTGSGLIFVDRGVHDLKGVPGPWQVYSVDC